MNQQLQCQSQDVSVFRFCGELSNCRDEFANCKKVRQTLAFCRYIQTNSTLEKFRGFYKELVFACSNSVLFGIRQGCMVMVRLLLKPNRMTFTELVIVYTSCGAPFAVERLLSDDRASNPVSITLASMVHLGLWPAFLLVRLLRVINGSFVSKKHSSDSKTPIPKNSGSQAIQQELALSLLNPSSEYSGLQIKDLLERYVGLASLLNLSQNGSDSFGSELSRITGHPSPGIAAACLNRRNAAVIQKHLAAARNEFLDLLSKAVENSPGKESILSLGLNLVDPLDGVATKQVLQLLANHRTPFSERAIQPSRIHLEETRATP